MNTSSSCPSSLSLLRYALLPEGEADGRLAEHVSACSTCRDLVAEHRAQGDSYMRSEQARDLLERLRAGEEKQRPRAGRQTWVWSGGLAAAAVLALVVQTRGRGSPPQSADGIADVSRSPSDILSPKGEAQLALLVEDEQGTAVELGASAVLSPGQRVQPAFAAPKRGFVALLLTTPKGEVIRLYPREGEQSAEVQAGSQAPLGPSFRLDEEVGMYRVSAYFGESRFPTAPLLVHSSGLKAQQREAPAFSGVVSTRRFEVKR